MKTQELKLNELKQVTGGFIGNDEPRIANVLKGYVSFTNQDEDEFEQSRADFGLASLTDIMND